MKSSNVVPIRKPAIVIDLDHLKRLMAEFCSETAGGSGPMDMQRRMHLSTFLAWVRKRQETTNGTTER